MEIKNKKIQPKDKGLWNRKMNKKEQDNNKRRVDDEEREADDNSKSFPNFSVLTQEERVVFFQALSTARKNVEKKGRPARERFGTVHDEYLKYFDQSDEGKQEARFTKSNLTLCDDGNHFFSEQFSVKVDQRNPQEKKCRSQTLKSNRKTFRESSTSVPLAVGSRRQTNSVVQLDENKLEDIFLEKSKRNEAECKNLQDIKTKPGKSSKTCEIVNGELEQNMRKNKKWFAKASREEAETPQFNILNAEEKEIFFNILQKARDNILEKDPGKKCDILPLDDVMKWYQRGGGVTTVFTTTEDSSGREGKKRDLKVTVTVTSRDNERLLLGHRQILTDDEQEKRKEINRKNKTEEDLRALGLSSNKVNTSEDEEDEKFCRSSEVMKKTKKNLFETIAARNEKEEENFETVMTLKTRQKKTDESKEKLILESPETLSKESCECNSDSSEISYPDTEINLYKNLSVNTEKDELKKGEISKSSQGAKIVSDLSVLSGENYDMIGKRKNIQCLKKNSVKEKRVDGWFLGTDSEKTKETVAQRQESFIDSISKKDCGKNKSAENIIELKAEGCVGNPVAVEQQDFEVVPSREISSLSLNPRKKDSDDVKLSFVKEGDERSNEEERNQKFKDVKEVTAKINMSEGILKESSWPKTQEFTINRVMLVNDDVVMKLKQLICYLEAKTNKDDYLEKEYLKLLMDYAHYLSKVLESLALRKEKQHKEEKSALVVADALFRGDENASVRSVNNQDFKKRCPSITLITKSEHNISKDLDRKSDLNLTEGLSGSECRSKSEKKTRKKTDRKIRLYQDLIRQRAELVEGSFEDFEISYGHEKKFIPKKKPASVQFLADECRTKVQQGSKINLFKTLMKWCACGKKKA